jgi:pimeloyl-ACP methyl ester carboxylesterase
VRRALTAAVALVVLAAGVAGAEDIKTIPTRPGVSQPFLFLRRAEKPAATVILFAGGNGALGLASGRLAGLGGNFLVRNRARFAEQGFMVAVPDAPSDHARGLTRFRSTAEHAADVRALIAALRELAPEAPVWVIGTSMGTVSAANAGARLHDGGPDGVVLTSSITRWNKGEGESVSDVKVKDIRVPTLVVHHRDDACPFTPYADIPGLLRDLSQAPRRELLTFSGGDPPESRPCEARAAHGYLGLDAEVVKAIADWIRATPRP